VTTPSTPELLTLHAVRLKGVADDVTVAGRFGLDQAKTSELLLDCQAYGWITWSEFAGTGGWSLTDRGRAENERQLATELDQAAGRETIHAAYREFLPLNGKLQQACTDWQIKPTPADLLAFNDHDDPQWDGRVIEQLSTIDQALRPLSERIGAVLARLGDYDRRFATALDRARDGDPAWIDRTDADSCHSVWFELHEDLIATLGVSRGG
jgi:hypothetical protein